MIAKPNDSNKIDTKVYKITKSSTKQQKVFFLKSRKTQRQMTKFFTSTTMIDNYLVLYR
jgi:hypothetical protein